MRFTVALAVLVICADPVAFQPAAQTPIAPPVTRFAATLTAIGTPQRSATMILTLDVQAKEASPRTTVSFQLPRGVRPVGGNGSWSGSLARGQRRTFMIRVQLADTGIFRIGARVSDTTRLPLLALESTAYSGLYVVTGAR